MYKSLLLFLMITAITGCNSLSRPSGERLEESTDARIASVRCMLLKADTRIDPEALDYVKARARDRNETCMTLLATMYREGGTAGVEQDFGKARELFAKVAVVDPSVMAILGVMAEYGEGQPVDHAKARTLYGLSGETGALRLGQLLEHGKGGPRDLPGAMDRYVGAVRHLQDDAWKHMTRLRGLGQPLTPAQQARCQDVWVRALAEQLRQRVNSEPVRQASQAAVRKGPAQEAQIRLKFISTSGTPDISLARKTGHAMLDAAILNAVSTVSLKEPPPVTDTDGTLEVNAPVAVAPGGWQLY